MKRVVSREMVAHLWANQSQSDARTATGNMSFDGVTLWSYRTPIAKLHTAGTKKKPRRVALISSNGYSMTTRGKHLPAARYALRGLGVAVFSVPYVGERGGMAPSMETHERVADGYPRQLDWHAANVGYLVNCYTSLRDSLSRARSLNSREGVTAALNDTAETARQYATLFKVRSKSVPDESQVLDDVRVIWAKYEAREARFNAPGAAEKRERTRAAAAARKERREAEERAARIASEAEARANWLNNLPAYGRRLTDERGGALLRLSSDGQTVQTSWGAECPADDARQLWPLVKACHDGQREFIPGGQSARYKLGSFWLTHIYADGTLRAGCHTIYWEQLLRCAVLLGLEPAKREEL